jgi:hypothetical protein
VASGIDDLFEESDFVTTPAVADFAGISPSSARAFAADLGLPRAGPSFVWRRDDVEALLDTLELNGEPDDEPDDQADEDEDGDQEDE